MKYRKYHVDTDYDLNSRGKKKGANRIVVNRGWTAIENGTPYITIQLQWYPLPWAGVCKGGKYENVRLTLEEYWYAEPEFYGVVGYMKLEGVSAFDLWQHIGKLEDEPPPLDNHPDAVTARLYMEGDPETVARLHIFD